MVLGSKLEKANWVNRIGKNQLMQMKWLYRITLEGKIAILLVSC